MEMHPSCCEKKTRFQVSGKPFLSATGVAARYFNRAFEMISFMICEEPPKIVMTRASR